MSIMLKSLYGNLNVMQYSSSQKNFHKLCKLNGTYTTPIKFCQTVILKMGYTMHLYQLILIKFIKL